MEYAASEPSASCICDAARNVPESVGSAIGLAALLSLPLAVLVLRRVPGLVRTRQSWFVPVHGFGEWVAFLMGIVAALALVAFLLAYFFAFAVER